jgi:hypothetical protein
LSSLRKRQSVASAMSLLGADLIMRFASTHCACAKPASFVGKQLETADMDPGNDGEAFARFDREDAGRREVHGKIYLAAADPR